MAAIISDPSLDGFNSFVSAEEADAYFAGVYFGDGQGWTDQAEKQNALLITATRRLSSLPWGGAPFIPGQVLAFPRNFVGMDEYGSHLSSDATVAPAIPQWLKDATCEMAMWIWTESDRPFSDVEFAQLKSQKIGPLDYVARDSALNMPPSVLAILKSLGGSYIYLGSGPRSVNIVL